MNTCLASDVCESDVWRLSSIDKVSEMQIGCPAQQLCLTGDIQFASPISWYFAEMLQVTDVLVIGGVDQRYTYQGGLFE